MKLSHEQQDALMEQEWGWGPWVSYELRDRPREAKIDIISEDGTLTRRISLGGALRFDEGCDPRRNPLYWRPSRQPLFREDTPVTPEEDEAWAEREAEQRMDAIGQNGNDGEHYDCQSFQKDNLLNVQFRENGTVVRDLWLGPHAYKAVMGLAQNKAASDAQVSDTLMDSLTDTISGIDRQDSADLERAEIEAAKVHDNPAIRRLSDEYAGRLGVATRPFFPTEGLSFDIKDLHGREGLLSIGADLSRDGTETTVLAFRDNRTGHIYVIAQWGNDHGG